MSIVAAVVGAGLWLESPVAAKAPARPASTALSDSDLAGLAVRAHEVEKDPFGDPKVVGAYVGRQFRVALKVRPYDMAIGANALWKYDREAGELVLTAHGTWWNLDPKVDPGRASWEEPNIRRAFEVSFGTREKASYTARNALGANLPVKWVLVTTVRVSAMGDGDLNRLSGKGTVGEVRVPMAAAAAKRLVPNLRMVIEGAIAPSHSGKVVDCTGRFSAATSLSLRDVESLECAVSVNYSRLAFEDASTGAVLAEWRR